MATGRAPFTSGLNLAAVNSATDRRGFVPVNERMQASDPGAREQQLLSRQPRAQRRARPLAAAAAAPDPRRGCPIAPQVLDTAGKVVPHVYCIGDANGKYMLAHAASAQVRGGPGPVDLGGAERAAMERGGRAVGAFEGGGCVRRAAAWA